MDKNEYKVRLEEIKQQIEQENYSEAAAIADQIEWKKVRNVNTLCMISEVYEAENRYEDSKVLLLRAYRRSPMSRTVLYRLVEVTIALRQFDEAIGYYTEYVQSAPNDTNRYILKYKIYRGRGSSVNEQIDILKEYLDQEYNEEYAYELAKLYREADRMQECIAACDDLVLWFHSGKYVIKALELKRKYAALTPKQQEIYDGRFAVEDEERELEEIGQEKQMVGTGETTLADSIMEDTERAIALEIAKAAKAEASEKAAAKAPAPEASKPEEPKTEVFPEKTKILERSAEPAEESQPAEKIKEEVQPAEEKPEETKADMHPAEESQEPGREEAATEPQPEEVAAEPQAEIRTAEEKPEEIKEEVQPVEESQEPEKEEAAAEEQPEEEKAEVQAEAAAEELQPQETAADGQSEEPVSAEEPEEETADEAPAEPARLKSKEELQTDIARDMRQIIGNVGRLEYIDETEQAMDDLIEESKKDQAREREKTRLRMPSLRMPDLQRKQAAGKLTIDDILLSMGERGDAVREAAAKASPYSQSAPGVLSAVDEALLNMGIQPEGMETKPEEEDGTPDKTKEFGRKEHMASAMTEIKVDTETLDSNGAAEEDTGSTTRELQEAFSDEQEVPDSQAAGQEAAGGKGEDLRAEEAEADEEDVKEASVKHGSLTDDDLRDALRSETGNGGEESFRDKTMEEIIAARTRRIPTDRISALYGRRPLDLEEAAADPVTETGNIPGQETDSSAEDGSAGSSPETAEENGGQVPEVSEELKGEQKEGPDDQDSSPEEGGEAGSQTADEKPEKEKTVPRGPVLRDDLRELFDGFLNVRGMETQIVNAIRQTLTKGNDRTSRTGNILIFGSHGSGKTTLAMALAKAIAQEKGQEYVKMARIYSTDLNRKDIAATIAKIAGGVLIVEEAGDLDDSIADQMTTAMEFRTDGLVVILEDEQAYIHDLLMRHPRLTMKFTSEIYIPPFTAEELAGFGEVYADSKDFALSDASREVLIDRVRTMMSEQESGQQVSINAVKEVMDRAMGKASGFGRKLFGGKKRYDELGRVILKEKDI